MFKFIKRLILTQIDIELDNINSVCVAAGKDIDAAIDAALKF